MIPQLKEQGGRIKTYDEEVMLEGCDHPWMPIKHPVSCNQVTCTTKQLTVTGISSIDNECYDWTLIAFKKYTDFDKKMDKWEKKAVVDKTWIHLKKFIGDEHAKIKVHNDDCNACTVGYGHANGSIIAPNLKIIPASLERFLQPYLSQLTRSLKPLTRNWKPS